MEGCPKLATHGDLSDPFLAGQGQRLQPPQGLLGTVGVNGRHRSGMPGVQGVDHVESLGPADFAHHDAIGAQSQSRAEKGAEADRPLPFRVGGPALQSDHMTGETQFGRVLDRDRAFAFGHGARQHVQERRLSGAGAAADQDVLSSNHHLIGEREPGLADRPTADEVVEGREWSAQIGGSPRPGGQPRPEGSRHGACCRPASRASIVGDARSSRSPSGAMTRSTAATTAESSGNRTSVRNSSPPRST